MQYPNKETLAQELFLLYAEPLAIQHGEAFSLPPWDRMSDTVQQYWIRIAAELIRHSSCWLPNKGSCCALDPAETKRIESWIPYTTHTSGKGTVKPMRNECTELMTISRARGQLAAIVHNTYANHRIVEYVVAALVQTQARRDAKVCLEQQNAASSDPYNLACQNCHDAVLKAAELDVPVETTGIGERPPESVADERRKLDTEELEKSVAKIDEALEVIGDAWPKTVDMLKSLMSFQRNKVTEDQLRPLYGKGEKCTPG